MREIIKIAAALIGALALGVVLAFYPKAVFTKAPPTVAGYELPTSTAAPKAAAAKELSLPELLVKADTKQGETVAKACAACHTFTKDGGVKVGPPLYGIVGRSTASVAGFAYSDGMKAKGGNWSLDNIFTFVANPKGVVPGTKMSFAGVSDAVKRANLLAYLNTLSDNPPPLK